MIKRVNAALRWDPRTFVAAFALWALLFGVGCLSTSRMFDIQPVFRVLRDTGLGEGFWGAVTVLDGALLMASLWTRNTGFRAAVACLSGALWAYIGVTMVISGFEHGFVSPAGSFSLAGSLGCLAATMQWVHQEGE